MRGEDLLVARAIVRHRTVAPAMYDGIVSGAVERDAMVAAIDPLVTQIRILRRAVVAYRTALRADESETDQLSALGDLAVDRANKVIRREIA